MKSLVLNTFQARPWGIHPTMLDRDESESMCSSLTGSLALLISRVDLVDALLLFPSPSPPLAVAVDDVVVVRGAFMTMRPGGYDVLLSSLAAQTDTRYELFCVDELAAARRKTVSAQAAALGVNLVGLQPGKERPNLPPQSGAETSAVGAKRRWRFGYANAMNTGLIGIASRHAGRSAGRIVHQTRLPCAALERW